MKTLLIIIFVSFSFSQTVADLTGEKLKFLTDYNFWYTSPAAGDSSKFYYNKFKSSLKKNEIEALKNFKKAYAFSIKNDRYEISKKTIILADAKVRIKNREFELAQIILKQIKFANERNTYVKRIRKLMEYMNTDIENGLASNNRASEAIMERPPEYLTYDINLNISSSLPDENHIFKNNSLLLLNISYLFSKYEIGLEFGSGDGATLHSSNGTIKGKNNFTQSHYSLFAKYYLSNVSAFNIYVKLGAGNKKITSRSLSFISGYGLGNESSMYVLGLGIKSFVTSSSKLFLKIAFDYNKYSKSLIIYDKSNFDIAIGIGYSY